MKKKTDPDKVSGIKNLPMADIKSHPITKKERPTKEKAKKMIEKFEIITPKDIEVKIERPTKEKAEGDPRFGKFEILTVIPIPDGYVRCQVLADYKGMQDDLYCGDIIDVPERRYKSLSFRGLVKQYKGELQPNKRR